MSAALIHRLAARLLGAHVRRGAEDHATPVIIAGLVIVGDCDTVVAERRRAPAPCEPEVEHLHGAVCAHLDVGRLQIAVDDPVLVRRFERLRDLRAMGKRLVERKRTRARCARRASGPSTSSITSAVMPSALFEPVDRGDVRMVQRGEDFRFALKAGEPVGVGGRGPAGP